MKKQYAVKILDKPEFFMSEEEIDQQFSLKFSAGFYSQFRSLKINEELYYNEISTSFKRIR